MYDHVVRQAIDEFLSRPKYYSIASALLVLEDPGVPPEDRILSHHAYPNPDYNALCSMAAKYDRVQSVLSDRSEADTRASMRYLGSVVIEFIIAWNRHLREHVLIDGVFAISHETPIHSAYCRIHLKYTSAHTPLCLTAGEVATKTYQKLSIEYPVR